MATNISLDYFYYDKASGKVSFNEKELKFQPMLKDGLTKAAFNPETLEYNEHLVNLLGSNYGFAIYSEASVLYSVGIITKLIFGLVDKYDRNYEIFRAEDLIIETPFSKNQSRRDFLDAYPLSPNRGEKYHLKDLKNYFNYLKSIFVPVIKQDVLLLNLEDLDNEMAKFRKTSYVCDKVIFYTQDFHKINSAKFEKTIIELRKNGIIIDDNIYKSASDARESKIDNNSKISQRAVINNYFEFKGKIKLTSDCLVYSGHINKVLKLMQSELIRLECKGITGKDKSNAVRKQRVLHLKDFINDISQNSNKINYDYLFKSLSLLESKMVATTILPKWLYSGKAFLPSFFRESTGKKNIRNLIKDLPSFRKS